MMLASLGAAGAVALPKSSPEQQGVSSTAILNFINVADENVNDIHSFMLLRHGKLITEAWWNPYQRDTGHMLFSLSKSFTSTAVGLAIAEGHLSLDDPIVSFFPDEVPEDPSWQLKSMRVRDLLSMSTGHDSKDLRTFSFEAETPLTTLFLHLPVAHKPGTHFLYNTPATYMCSAIIQKVTGSNLVDYLKTRLFKPLGIENPEWSQSPQGIAHGGFGLNVTTEDIARLGQLYLQGGVWDGRQLLSESWVREATSRQTSTGSNPQNDWDQGYGYQFWRCRNNAYRGDGAFGQFCIVMPEQDAVIAITSGTSDMQGILNLVWDHLLPAMSPNALDQDPANYQKLTKRIHALQIKTVQSNLTQDQPIRWLEKTFQLEVNDLGFKKISVSKTNRGEHKVQITTLGGIHDFLCRESTWNRDDTSLSIGIASRRPNRPVHPMATTGAWTTENQFQFKVAYTETPLVVSFNLDYDKEQVSLDVTHSVAFGVRKGPSIIGIIQP